MLAPENHSRHLHLVHPLEFRDQWNRLSLLIFIFLLAALFRLRSCERLEVRCPLDGRAILEIRHPRVVYPRIVKKYVRQFYSNMGDRNRKLAEKIVSVRTSRVKDINQTLHFVRKTAI